jgi:hypothetical protein
MVGSTRPLGEGGWGEALEQEGSIPLKPGADLEEEEVEDTYILEGEGAREAAHILAA